MHFESLEPRILLSADLDLLSTTALTSPHKDSSLITTIAATPKAAPAPQVSPTEKTSAAFLDAYVKPSAVVPQAKVAVAQVLPAAATTETWIGGTSGIWDKAANWSGGVIPDQTYDVIIAGKDTITLGTDAAHSLSLSGGVTLTGGALTTSAASTSDGSSFQGTSLTLGANLTLTGSSTLTSTPVTVLSGALTNAGTLLITGSADQTLAGTLDNTGTIDQASGGLNLNGTLTNAGSYIIENDSGIDGGSITNTGLIKKSAGTGTSNITDNFTNIGGTLDAGSGTLDVTSYAALQGGTFDADANASVVLYGRTPNIYFTVPVTGSFTGTGAGMILFENHVQIGTGGATFDFAPGLAQVTGEIDAGDGSDFTNTSLTNSGALELTTQGGTAGDLALDGPLINSGTLTVSGTFNLHGRSGLGTLTNTKSGTIDLVDGTIESDEISTGYGSVINDGVLEASGGSLSAISAQTLTFNADSTIDVASGTLDVGAANWQGATLKVAVGATLALAGGTYAGTFTDGGPNSGTIDFTGGTIGAAGATFDFDPGVLQWTSGFIDATLGVLTNSGTMTLSGTGTDQFDGTIDNTGTILQSNDGLDIGFYNGPQATLNNSGSYVLQNDSGLAGQNNSGLAGAGDASVFVNTGTLRKLADTGTSTISSVVLQGGTIDTGADTILQLAGAITLGGILTGTGSGLVELNGNSFTAAAGGATFDFAPGGLQFQQGRLDGGTSGFTNIGTMTLNQTATVSQFSGVFNNTGTFDIVGVSAFELLGDATFTNEAGALVDFQGDGSLGVGNGGRTTFINDGTLRKSAGTLTELGAGGFDTAGGTIDVEAGTIDLDSLGVRNGGNYVVAAGATLDVSGGTSVGTFTGSGKGTVAFMGTTVGAAGVTFDFAPGVLDWSGTINASRGTFTNSGTMSLLGGNVGGLFDNTGTLLQTGGDLDLDATGDFGAEVGGIIDNSGLYDIEGDYSASNNYLDGSSIDNTGTIRKSGGTGTGVINPGSFSSTGTVSVSSGTLAINSGPDQDLSGTTLQAGTWTVSNGATLDLRRAIATNAATIAIDGAGSKINDLTQLSSNTGSLTLSGGATLTTAGDLSNSGTVTLGAGSSLAVAGNYSQTSAGTLGVTIGGTPSSTAFGTLDVTGSATLGGTLVATLANGFAPTAGTAFPVVTFASATGAFATVQSQTVGGAPVFTAATSGTAVTLKAVAQGADLATTSVTLPSGTATPGQPASVSFTVTNDGGAAATGSWADSVYISAGNTFDSTAVLLGRVTHSGGLGAGQSYSDTLTAALPALIDGNYSVFVLADSGKAVADTNRADNLAAATAPLVVTLPVLTLGAPTSGTTASGQDAYYKVVGQPGGNITLTGTFAGAGDAQIYVGSSALPTQYSFDQTTGSTAAAQSLTLTNVASGTFYVLVHGLAAGTFSLTAATTPLSITSLVSTNGIGNQTSAVIGLVGTQFTSKTTVSLVAADGTVYAAKGVTYLYSTAIAASFDLTGIPAGTYTVVAKDGAQSASATTSYTVVPLTETTDVSALNVSIKSPGEVLGGASVAPFPVSVTFQNPTNTPILISEFDIIGKSATFPFVPLLSLVTDNQGNQIETAQLISPAAPVLVAAGGTYSIVVFAYPNPTDVGTQAVFTGQFAGANDGPLDLVSLSAALKPANVSQAAWNAILQNFSAAIGTTTFSLSDLEQNDDTILQLASGSAPLPTSSDALSLELVKASDALPTPVLDTATDVSYPAPGLSLTFDRAFQSSIIGRYTDGRLGQGWVDNWDYSASLDSTSNQVTIQEGAATRTFTANANGTFTASAGDTGVLTEVLGAYHLTEANGSVTNFNSDGTLNFVQDAAGDRITASYTGGEMTKLTASDGDALTIGYNAEGKIASVTDPSGRVATYAYDSTGQELISVTTVAGTSTYTYETDTTGPSAYELTSIGDPGGTHVYFSYDSQGRLTTEQGDGGAGALTYSYGVDSYTVTDAAGNATTTFFNQVGAPVATIDALGHISTAAYNNTGAVTSLGEVGGGASTINYGTTKSGGSATTTIDPAGDQTSLTYTSGYGALTGSTDQDGNVTSYGHDANGNVTSITYADGSKATYSYAANGTITQSVDRNGDKSTYIYDSRGELLSQKLSDGTTTSYTYDAHGNMLTATDASGTITMVYDGADRLTKITYPDGRFLAYTYDAGGRRTSSTDQDGFTTDYSYDAQGRLATMTDGTGALIAKYSYDALGNLVRQDNGNGTYTTKSYDAVGDVLSIVNHAPDGSVNSSFIYTYDALGRVATMTTLAGTATYSYDADSRLTGAKLPDGTTIAYSYDAAGNRTAVVTNGVSTAYTTNDLNEYVTVGGTVQAYDAGGDLTSGDGSTYTYDALGRLASVTNAGGTWTYQYDALGNRSSETHNGVTTSFLVDPTGLGNVVAEYDASGKVIASYTYGNGLTSQVTSGGADYYDFDALGSTAGLSGASGKYVASYTYDPFGKVLSSTGTATNPFQYNGQLGIQSDGSGLDDMRARSYDPVTGRFTQPDPIGIFGGINTYSYALNNPITNADPSGFVSAVDAAAFLLAASGNVTLVLDSLDPSTNPVGFYAGFITGYLQSTLLTGSALVKDTTLLVQVLQEAGVEKAAIEGIVGFGGINGAKLIASAAEGAAFFLIQKEIDWAEHEIEQDIFADLDSTLNVNAVLASINAHSLSATSTTEVVGAAHDPNFISGPAGYGSGQFITGGGTNPYELTFTNEATADTPARTVTVTEKLDPNLDLSTFQLGSFGFGNQVIEVPPGLQNYETRVDDRANTGVFVDVSIHLDTTTRTLTATYTSIDPSTLDVESDVSMGFLPPDKVEPDGTGFLTYSVAPKAGLASGTTITAQGSVVFDTEAPVITNAFVNTIDNDPPTSKVTALPATSTAAAIPLTWSGSDGAGSGIASYSIYVSTDGGSYVPFLQATTATAAVFQGTVGHTYRFYSVATDNVGFVQATPATADATTYVDTPPVAAAVSGAANEHGPATTITASYTDPDIGDTHSFTDNTTGTKGLVANNGNGTFSYNPNGAFASLKAGATATDSFTYTVTDGSGLSSSATATITITGQDDAPVAAAVSGAVNEHGPATTITARYTDPDIGDTHSFTDNTTGTKGLVTNNGNGTFSYNPNGAFASLKAGATATDSFTYTVTDGSGLSSTATVTITITGQYVAPVAAADGPYQTTENTVLHVGGAGVLTNDTDPQGLALTALLKTAPSHGSLKLNADGSFDYTPTQGYVGTDSFTYVASDGTLSSNPTTVSLQVGSPQQDTLVLRVAAQSYKGDPQFTVAVDGIQVGGVQTTSASNAAGLYQDITLTGNFGPNPQQVTITYINDAWAGLGNVGDRNLFVDSITLDGKTFLGSSGVNHAGHIANAGGTAELNINGSIVFNVAPTQLQTLTLRVAAQSYDGDPQFTVAVDGVQVGGVQTASASYAAGLYQDITLTGNFGPNPQQVTVTYINDAWAGLGKVGDRNLFVDSITLDGQTFLGSSGVNHAGHLAYGSSGAELNINGSIVFNVAPTPTVSVASSKIQIQPNTMVSDFDLDDEDMASASSWQQDFVSKYADVSDATAANTILISLPPV